MDLKHRLGDTVVCAPQTYRKIDGECFGKRVYGPNSRIGSAIIVKTKPSADVAMDQLAGQSTDTVSPIDT